ncbi:serine/arginine repetitive matrix protein 5 isoform X2 [Ricinus communis]|uniref:ATP binding protein n=1 Tax=Ricinus communis TaxID=3988 RepID=B9SQ42_RICCO|nr:serine/arginine repetitive matrix protein 5 isoform X2 [Ricinus communis]EEF34290.1 conserved hypothetical protein [Ricinus communis]|eukprot:XP_002528111.1 serine/arginine repetitive matrix protein 5 isoform X2 [Ricinus communis]
MVTKEKDEELALFLEMRRREKDNALLDPPLGTNNALVASPISKIVSSVPMIRKTAADKFLDSENDKSDYDWLLTPPGTPLFPSWEKESQKTVMSQNGISNTRVTALKSRLTNIQEEPALRSNIASKRTTLPSQPSYSNTSNRRPSSSGGPASATRPATPTGRPTLSTTTKPSRASTPTSRATLPSSKPMGNPVRSSTPTRTVARSSTPTARPSVPASKSTSRSATPTRQMTTPSSAPCVAAPPGGRSSSVTKSNSILKNPVQSRGSSPTVKSRPWKPNEMPGFSLDAPPNLRTSLPERPASATRGRPAGAGAGARSSSIESGSKVRPRQQSCSPARGRASNGSANGSRISIPTKGRAQNNGSDDVNPILMGTKMVERVVNMRKLAPPKQDDHHSLLNNSGGKSSSLDSTGFGRTLSKKSLDMALRHMDIRRSISGNLRPLTSIPASSVYSVRSGGSTKGKTSSVLDSPLATSSNASSEPSVNNNSLFADGIEMEVNDFGSENGNCSPTSHSGK